MNDTHSDPPGADQDYSVVRTVTLHVGLEVPIRGDRDVSTAFMQRASETAGLLSNLVDETRRQPRVRDAHLEPGSMRIEPAR